MKRHSGKITLEDISSGLRKHATKCPVALALQRAFPEKTVGVGPTGLFFVVDKDCPLVKISKDKVEMSRLYKKYIEYHPRAGKLSPTMGQFIKDFDAGKKVTPRKFTFSSRDAKKELANV